MDKPNSTGASAEPQAARASGVRYLVMALVAFASSSAYLTRYCVSAANTTIQGELGLDDKQFGWVLGAFSLGYLFFQVPGGWLGNRFGTRFAFAFLSVFWSLCNVWSGASSLLISLVASRFGLGAFQAGLTPLSAKILRDWIPAGSRGMSSAAITACMSIGGAFTLSATGWLLSKGVDWRTIFFAYSLVGVVWAAVYYGFFRTYPEDHARVNGAELELIRHSPVEINEKNAEKLAAAKPAIAGESEAGEWRRLLFSLNMLGLCVQSFCRAAGYAFFVTWFFAFLEYVHHISKAEAGLLTSLPLLAVVCGTVVGGVSVDGLLRITGSKWVSRSGTAVVALGCSGLFTLASAWSSTAVQLSVVIAVGAFFSGIGSPAAWAATIDIGGKQTAVAMGVMNMAGCLAGFVLPIFLGDWFDQIRQSGGDWNAVIYLHAAFYFVAAGSWLIVRSGSGEQA